MEGAEFHAARTDSWLSAWQLNLARAQDRGEGERRRIWARVAFAALNGAGQAGLPAWEANMNCFNLRTLLIIDLGPGDDPLWDPDRLALDVLEALPLSLEQAVDWAEDWRARPRDEILALRICKNLLAPMELIADRLAEGPVEVVPQLVELDVAVPASRPT